MAVDICNLNQPVGKTGEETVRFERYGMKTIVSLWSCGPDQAQTETAGHFKKARPHLTVPEKGSIDVCFTNPSKTESGRIW